MQRRLSIFGFLVSVTVSGLLGVSMYSAAAAPGDWPEPRQNPHLTAIQPLPGAMLKPPVILAKIEVSQHRPAMTQIPSPDGSETWGLCVVGGALRCFDTKGEEKWVAHPPGLNFGNVVTEAGDLDGDGRTEIAIKAGRPAEPYSAAALVSGETGKLLWQYDVEPMSYSWDLHVDHFFPGSVSKQLVVLMQGYPPDKDNGYIVLFDFKTPGERPTQVWRYDFHQYTCYPPVMRVDLEGDGVDELAIVTHSQMWLLDVYTGAVKQYLGWDVSPGNARSYGMNRFVDLNNDGLKDFLCIADFAQHHEVLLNKNGKLEQAWHHGWGESVMTGKVVTTWPDPPHADVDGDGELEIVVSMYNSEKEDAWLIRVYDAVTGRLEYSAPGAIAAAVGDVDGDGIAEIGANISSDPTNTERDGARLLEVVDGTLSAVWEETSGAFSAGPAKSSRTRTGPRSGGTTPESGFRFMGKDGTSVFSYEKKKGPVFETHPHSAPVASVDFSAVPPLKIGQYPTLLAADITGDGQNEILIYTGNMLRAVRLEPDGAIREVFRCESSGLPGISDLNGDGALEIITARISKIDRPVVEAHTPALNNRLLWRKQFPVSSHEGLPWTSRPFYVRAGRFTGKETPDLYVWAGMPVVRSVVLDGLTGEIVWERNQASAGRYWGPTHNLVAVADYDADGNEDLFFTNPDQFCVGDGAEGEFLLGPLSQNTFFKQPSMGLYTLPAILDTKTTPIVCFFGGHYFQAAMSLPDKPLWYALPVTGEARTASQGFLQAQDGSWLMGIGRQNGKFACVNVADGELRWELDLQASCAEICTLDVDGDGYQEFIAETSHGTLYAIGDEAGRPRQVWCANLPANGGVPGHFYPAGYGAPIAADVNNDGRSEILVSLQDGCVYVLGTAE